MKRLYYLSPTIESTEQISEDLHEHGVTDWRFHVLSKDEAGLYNHHLHSANTFQRTDLVRYMERGLICGAIVGVLFLIPLAYLEDFTVKAWLAISFFSVLFGIWCGGVGGISQENYKIQRFHDEIEGGKYLIMVDVPKPDEELIRRLMSIRHPEASIQGHTSTFTNPFARPIPAMQH